MALNRSEGLPLSVHIAGLAHRDQTDRQIVQRKRIISNDKKWSRTRYRLCSCFLSIDVLCICSVFGFNIINIVGVHFFKIRLQAVVKLLVLAQLAFCGF